MHANCVLLIYTSEYRISSNYTIFSKHYLSTTLNMLIADSQLILYYNQERREGFPGVSGTLLKQETYIVRHINV